MPYILDELGNEPTDDTVQQAFETDVPQSIAWTLDPYAPVPSDYAHLVKNPNEDGNTDEQEEGK